MASKNGLGEEEEEGKGNSNIAKFPKFGWKVKLNHEG